MSHRSRPSNQVQPTTSIFTQSFSYQPTKQQTACPSGQKNKTSSEAAIHGDEACPSGQKNKTSSEAAILGDEACPSGQKNKTSSEANHIDTTSTNDFFWDSCIEIESRIEEETEAQIVEIRHAINKHFAYKKTHTMSRSELIQHLELFWSPIDIETVMTNSAYSTEWTMNASTVAITPYNPLYIGLGSEFVPPAIDAPICAPPRKRQKLSDTEFSATSAATVNVNERHDRLCRDGQEQQAFVLNQHDLQRQIATDATSTNSRRAPCLRLPNPNRLFEQQRVNDIGHLTTNNAVNSQFTHNASFIANDNSDSTVPANDNQISNPDECCPNPEIYHKFTMCPTKRAAVIQFHHDGSIPETHSKTSSKKQSFRKEAAKYKVTATNDGVQVSKIQTKWKYKVNNLLVKAADLGKVPESARFIWKTGDFIVPPCGQLQQVFDAHHGPGHHKKNKCMKALDAHYKLKNCKNFVDHFLSRCVICAHTQNKTNQTYIAPLRPNPIPSEPVTVFHLDEAGAFPLTHSGNQYICLAIDRLTKYPEVIALPSKDSEYVALFIVDLHVRYGNIHIIVTDNGGEFANQTNKRVCELLNVDHRFITALHPQANGPGEKGIGIFKKCLKNAQAQLRGDFTTGNDSDTTARKGHFDYGTDWDEMAMKLALYQMRMFPQISTGYSPLEALTGKRPVYNLADFEHQDNDDYSDPKWNELTKESFERRYGRMTASRQQFKKSLRKAQIAMKKKWDQKRGCTQQPKVNDKVLYRNGRTARSISTDSRSVWRPLKGYGVVKEITEMGVCKVKVNGQITLKVRIENVKVLEEAAVENIDETTNHDANLKKKRKKRKNRSRSTTPKKKKKGTKRSRTTTPKKKKGKK